MKTCPICNAGAFDDAEVCYGCLHRFDESDSSTGTHQVMASQTGSPALLISVQAVKGGEGGFEWCCDVDGRTLRVPLSS